MRTEAHIVAMGGGGFSMEMRNPRLDRYVLSLTSKSKPRVCFVGTASGDSLRYIAKFYRAFAKHRCVPSHLPLFQRETTREPTRHLLEQDVIYVGGGNTANLLAVWRTHGVDRAMRRAWEKGVVLCGVSAGMICWFEASCTDSFSELKELRDGMGFIPGSACPHYDGEAKRRATFHRLIKTRKLPDGLAADDGAAAHFIGRELARCVSSRPSAKAYDVRLTGGRVSESLLPTTYLSGK